MLNVFVRAHELALEIAVQDASAIGKTKKFHPGPAHAAITALLRDRPQCPMILFCCAPSEHESNMTALVARRHRYRSTHNSPPA